LNANKTKVYSLDEFRALIKGQLGDAFGEAEREAIEALSHAVYFEEDFSDDDLTKLRALNLLEMLDGELRSEIWDFGRIKAIFRALRLAPDPESMEFITNNLECFCLSPKNLSFTWIN